MDTEWLTKDEILVHLNTLWNDGHIVEVLAIKAYIAAQEEKVAALEANLKSIAEFWDIADGRQMAELARLRPTPKP
jgi:hypothetical protein